MPLHNKVHPSFGHLAGSVVWYGAGVVEASLYEESGGGGGQREAVESKAD